MYSLIIDSSALKKHFVSNILFNNLESEMLKMCYLQFSADSKMDNYFYHYFIVPRDSL